MVSPKILRLRQLLNDLSNQKLEELADISLNYPPRARALAGALLDWSGANNKLTSSIADSLNPLSAYNFGISKSLLPVAEKWKIY